MTNKPRLKTDYIYIRILSLIGTFLVGVGGTIGRCGLRGMGVLNEGGWEWYMKRGMGVVKAW